MRLAHSYELTTRIDSHALPPRQDLLTIAHWQYMRASDSIGQSEDASAADLQTCSTKRTPKLGKPISRS